jgi:hypothetical protein
MPAGNPPLGFTEVVQFNNIDTQVFVQGEAGGVVSFTAQVEVRIDGNTNGVFSVQGLETLALVLDPEIRERVWTTVATQNNAGPINVRSHEALGVIIGCSVPADAQDAEFNAAAVVVQAGTQSPSLMVIKLRATANLVGRVTIVEEGSDVLSGGFLAGETAPFKFIFESTLRHDVTGPFSCISTPDAAFTSPAIPVTVPGRVDANSKRITALLPVTCRSGTAPGFHNAEFAFEATSSDGRAGTEANFKVLARRSVNVTQNLAQPLVLRTGTSKICRITADDSGGFSVIVVTAGSVPPGIGLDIGQPFPITFPPVPDGRRLDGVDVTISALPDARIAPGFHPLVLNWVVPADDSHRAVSGSLTIDVGVVSTPLAPVDLFPPNGSFLATSRPILSFRDPGVGTPAEVTDLDYVVTQNGTIVGPAETVKGPLSIAVTAAPADLTWPFGIPNGTAVLTVVGKNAAGAGPSSSSVFTVQESPQPQPPPQPPPVPQPAPGTLTMQAVVSLPADSQSITQAAWSVSGPGAPTTAINAIVSGATAQGSAQLPAKPGVYVIQGKVAFSYTGLVQANGGFSSDSTETQSAPVQINWSGKSAVARFAVVYDELNNIFVMKFDGLFGS